MKRLEWPRLKTLQIKVKPNARASTLIQADDGIWLAQLKSVPVGGKANAELLALIAETLGVRRAQITIRSGASGRMKLVVILD